MRLERRGNNRPFGRCTATVNQRENRESAVIHPSDVAFGIRSIGRPKIGGQIFYKDMQCVLDTMPVEKESTKRKNKGK
jgi:hypothetical protein